jgi:multidrug efflux system membrane fusion protein
MKRNKVDMRTSRVVFTLAVIGAIAGGVYYWMQGTTAQQSAGGRQRTGGPVSILAEPARNADVPVYLEGVGSAKARNTVTVRAQVDGKLLSVNFKEGEDVKKGDVLAKIDPVTYKAQLDQAAAKKALDEALLANSRRDLERYEKVGTLAITQQQIDTQRALIAQQEAQIKQDDASIENLTAILGYTDIVAPIDGRTGIRQVDEGNLVHAGDATGIVVITEIKPISVMFTLPQQNLPTLSRANAAGVLQAEAFTTDSHEMLDTGTLQVIDNQVDPTTGTVRLKADFPNSKLQLWPGQFVNVRLLVDTLKNVVVAPTAAVQRGPNGPYVYVVNDDKTVSMRPVKVAQQDERDAVFSEGVKAGENVVTSGFSRLEDGAKVKIGDRSAPAAPGGNKPSADDGKAPEGQSNKADATAQNPSVQTGLAEAQPDAAQRKHKHHRENGGAQ